MEYKQQWPKCNLKLDIHQVNAMSVPESARHSTTQNTLWPTNMAATDCIPHHNTVPSHSHSIHTHAKNTHFQKRLIIILRFDILFLIICPCIVLYWSSDFLPVSVYIICLTFWMCLLVWYRTHLHNLFLTFLSSLTSCHCFASSTGFL